MAKLNPRQELFAQELAQGKTADEAYRLAGYRADRHHAARLATKGHIAERVAALQRRAADRMEITIERLTREFYEDRDLAQKFGQVSASVAALTAIGKLHGMFIDRSENVNFDYRLEDELPTSEQWEAEHTKPAHVTEH